MQPYSLSSAVLSNYSQPTNYEKSAARPQYKWTFYRRKRKTKLSFKPPFVFPYDKFSDFLFFSQPHLFLKYLQPCNPKEKSDCLPYARHPFFILRHAENFLKLLRNPKTLTTKEFNQMFLFNSKYTLYSTLYKMGVHTHPSNHQSLLLFISTYRIGVGRFVIRNG